MATYYVDGAVGDDGNAGTSEGSGNAWATIQFAADTAVAGDIVYVKASASYAEDVDIDTNEGIAGSLITFEGYTTTPGDGGQATIDGGNSLAHNITATDRDHINLFNFILTGATDHCVDILTGNLELWHFDRVTFTDGAGTPTNAFGRSSGFRTVFYSTFTRCLIENMSGNGLDQIQSNNTFKWCTVRNNGGHGILTGTFTSGNVFYQNRIYGNVQDGINLPTSAGGMQIFGNMIHNNGNGGTGSGIFLHGADHRGSVLIEQNFLSGHSGASEYGIECGTLSGTSRIIHGGNVYYNNTVNRHSNLPAAYRDDYDLSVDPFVDAANADFNINNTAGGGALLRAVTFDMPGGGTAVYPFRHLVSDAFGGGSSTTIIKRPRRVM